VALLLLALYAFGRGGWQSDGATGTPVLGANFSCKQAEYLGMDCGSLFARVLDDLGVRQVRISAYWSDIEREPGVYDFAAVDRLLDLAENRDARVTVSIGMRAQRYPEFWFPTWLRLAAGLQPGDGPEDHPMVRAALFPYLAAAAAHIGAHPAVEALQVENEPFVPSYAYDTRWRIRPEFVAEEIRTVRAHDPGGNPIVVSHASWTRFDDHWRWILDHADILAQSVYVKRQRGPWPWLYIFPYRIGPLAADLPGQADAAARRGKQLWVGELQAEPFERPDVDVRRIPTDHAASFSARWLEENLRLAARTGATRVYLWGVEWWAYLHDVRGEPELWEMGRRIFGAGAAPDGRAR
jgi:hypothetical protein